MFFSTEPVKMKTTESTLPYKGDTTTLLHNKDPIIGYFQNVTAVKESSKHYKYFNFNIQTKDQMLEGVCFEVGSRNQISQKQEIQKPVKVTHYSLKPSIYNPNIVTIVVNRRTQLQNCNCDFEYRTPQIMVTKITNVAEFSDFAKVAVIGRVHISSEPKKQKLSEDREILRQECKIADETGAIRMTVWAEAIEKVQNDHSYHIVDARVRTYMGQKYFSVSTDTVINEVSYDKQISDSATQLYDSSTEEETITLHKFDGVQSISRYFHCSNCNKRLSELQGKVQCCDTCGVHQIIAPGTQQYLAISTLIKDSKLTVKFNNDQVEQILNIFNEQTEAHGNLQTTSADSEIIEAFLMVNELEVTYNTTSKLVTKITSLKQAST